MNRIAEDFEATSLVDISSKVLILSTVQAAVTVRIKTREVESLGASCVSCQIQQPPALCGVFYHLPRYCWH